MGQAFSEASCINEDQRRGVLAYEVGDLVEHLSHLLARSHRFEIAFRKPDRKIERALVPAVDHLTSGRQVCIGSLRASSDEQPRNCFDRSLGCGQTDPSRPRIAKCCEPFE